MANKEGKEYQQNGKTIKIIPIKKVKKTESKTKERGSATSGRSKKSEEELGVARYAVGDKVTLKNIPAEYSGAGFAESVITKVFKSTTDQKYRYSIKSSTGRELQLLQADQLKPRK